MPLHNGTLLNNRYRIERILGQGGMGAVYLATDESLGMPAAVKENLNVSPESERQFKREATLLASLRHHNLPRVTNHFVLGGQQYLVMDFVEGEDLKEHLMRAGKPSEADVVRWGLEVCNALIYLHGLNPPVVHRDIKPGNIKLNAQGEAMLVDFGIAKAASSGSKTTTAAAAFTPGFAPPEQYGMGRTDPRTDQYALAATLYNLLTGETPPDSMERLLGNTQIQPPDQLRPGLSAAVATALMRALELRPEHRFESAAQFKEALQGKISAAGMTQMAASATPTVMGGAMSGSMPTMRSEAAATIPATPSAPPASGRRGWLFPALVIGALVLVGGGLLGGALLSGGAFTTTPPPAATTQAVAQVSTTAPSETPEPTEIVAPTNTTAPQPTDTPTAEPPTPTAAPTPTVAGTQVGGATGRIAFISNRDGKFFQIYTMNADGSDIQQLTTDDTDKWSLDWQLGRLGKLNGAQLAWSPDGTKLLYIARPKADADLDVWVINADGSNAQNLTPSRPGFVSGDEIQPVWCNDGTIAFTSTRINNTPQILIMRLEDRTPRNFSATRASPMEFGAQFFSDCRRMLLITTQNGDAEIWRMFPFPNVTGQMWGTFPPKDQTSYRPFLSDLGSGARAQEISISPDDQFVLYTRTKVSDGSSEIVVTTVSDSQNTMQVNTLTNTQSNAQPSWSPDGKWITFISKRDSQNQQIFRMRFNGAEQTNLTNDPDHLYVSPAWQPALKP